MSHTLTRVLRADCTACRETGHTCKDCGVLVSHGQRRCQRCYRDVVSARRSAAFRALHDLSVDAPSPTSHTEPITTETQGGSA